MTPLKLLQELVPTLFEDENVLVVNKPAGVDVGRGGAAEAEGLVDWLLSFRDQADELVPVNRLSRYESGALVLAKNRTTHGILRKTLRDRHVQQEFVAVVEGRMGKTTLHLGAKGESAKRRTRSSQTRAKTRGNISTPASTVFTRLYEGPKRTLIRCATRAETTHRLRAELRSVGLRLVGDSLRQAEGRRKRHAQTCLHLSRIAIRLPGVGRPRVLRSNPPRMFRNATDGERDYSRRLHAALTRRLACLAEPDTDIYRLITGSEEDLSGVVVECFGPALILQLHGTNVWTREDLKALARWYMDRLDITAVYVKRFAKDRASARGQDAAAHDESKPFMGRAVAEEIVARERGLNFRIRPYDGLSVGLYANHRENRSRIRSLSKDKDVLNLFSYTCGFSVAAASGQAAMTVSVDVSKKFLDWGRRNFEANALNPDDHRFVTSSAFDFLKRTAKRGEAFDIIILDPPTFAHARKRGADFSVSRDLAELIGASLGVLRPAGILLVSTNYRRMSLSGMQQRIERGAGRRKFKILETPPLPPDFATDPDHAKTMLVQFE